MYIQRRQTLINAVRPLARDESAVFLLYLPSVCLFLLRLFALTMQLRPTLYLPVAATTSNRVRTKILELIGVKPQISSKYNFKNLRNYLHISKKMRIFALDFKSVLFPVWSNRLCFPFGATACGRTFQCPTTDHSAPLPPRPKIEVL